MALKVYRMTARKRKSEKRTPDEESKIRNRVLEVLEAKPGQRLAELAAALGVEPYEGTPSLGVILQGMKADNEVRVERLRWYRADKASCKHCGGLGYVVVKPKAKKGGAKR